MIDFAADCAIFLDDSEHSAVVGLEEPVLVLYEAPFKPVPMYGEDVASTSPACSMLDADIERLGVAYGTIIDIQRRGSLVGSFTVTGVEPDGNGLTRLVLTTAEA